MVSGIFSNKTDPLNLLFKIANGESGTFGFAFIDADKPNYDNYYERCLKLIRPGKVPS